MGIDVDAVDDASGESDSESDDVVASNLENDSMEEELQEAIEILEEAKDDADAVLSVGLCVGYTDGTEIENPDGEQAEGQTWRVINPTAHDQYETVAQLLKDVQLFDANLSELEILVDDPHAAASKPDMDEMVGALLGR